MFIYPGGPRAALAGNAGHHLRGARNGAGHQQGRRAAQGQHLQQHQSGDYRGGGGPECRHQCVRHEIVARDDSRISDGNP